MLLIDMEETCPLGVMPSGVLDQKLAHKTSAEIDNVLDIIACKLSDSVASNIFSGVVTGTITANNISNSSSAWIPNRHIIDNPNGNHKVYFCEDKKSLASFGMGNDGDVAIVGETVLAKEDGKWQTLYLNDELDDMDLDTIRQEAYDEGYRDGKLQDDLMESFIKEVEEEADAGTLCIGKFDVITWDHKADKNKKIICIGAPSTHRTYVIDSVDPNSIFNDYLGFNKSEIAVNDVVVCSDGESYYWTEADSGNCYFGSVYHNFRNK